LIDRLIDLIIEFLICQSAKRGEMVMLGCIIRLLRRSFHLYDEEIVFANGRSPRRRQDGRGRRNGTGWRGVNFLLVFWVVASHCLCARRMSTRTHWCTSNVEHVLGEAKPSRRLWARAARISGAASFSLFFSFFSL
jgi:hypothetical protein